ncbi:hypothetical protein D9M70_593010 [compost metagenome]
MQDDFRDFEGIEVSGEAFKDAEEFVFVAALGKLEGSLQRSVKTVASRVCCQCALRRFVDPGDRRKSKILAGKGVTAKPTGRGLRQPVVRRRREVDCITHGLHFLVATGPPGRRVDCLRDSMRS